MNHQSPLFSCGLELATVVAGSDLLTSSWDAISELSGEVNGPDEGPLSSCSVAVKYKTPPRSKFATAAFVPSPVCAKYQVGGGGDLAPLSTLKEICPHFDFLCTKSNQSLSISTAVATSFASLHPKLSEIKAKILADKSGPPVITGHSLGGSVASLFTLWLLEGMNLSTSKRPICITFGSPPVGDNGLRQAISGRKMWNSCFLHVLSRQDPVPGLFVSNQSGLYRPFGTYLLCSESGAACFEKEAESILELVMAEDLESNLSCMTLDRYEGFPNVDYGRVVENLKSLVVYKGKSKLGELVTEPLWAGYTLQLETIGIKRTLQHKIDVPALVKRAEDVEKQKRKAIDPVKSLNDSKITMAYLEWYKMDSKAMGIGYYDTYKRLLLRQDIGVIKYKKLLTNYWEDEVAKAENSPQREGAFLRTGWLGAGTNYRRMVECLHIADYYRNPGAQGYLTNGSRPRHFILLEKWQRENQTQTGFQNAPNEQREAFSLTEDSCFWAHVEEAIISCNLMNDPKSSPAEKESFRSSLIEFEGYVMELIRNYAVSPEIFLGESSFMQWWRKYEMIIETDHSQPLTVFMRNREYERYA